MMVFILMASSVQAQQQPWYSQYILNNFIINPALAGIESYWDARASYRYQWQGIQGAPITYYASAQGPLRGDILEDESATTIHPQFNARGYDYWNNYQTAPSHFGIGFTLINDKTGPLNNTSAKASLAYHLKVSRVTALSLGFSLGLQEITLNTQNLYFGVQNPNDPAVFTQGSLNSIKPDLNLGLWYYSSKYFLGLSAQQIIPQSLIFTEGQVQNPSIQKGTLVPHLFLQGGYKILLNQDWSVLSSFTLRSISPLPLGFDLNAKFQYHDYFWMGGTYRFNSGYAAMIGFSTNFNILVGYSYDFNVSPLNSVAGGTHEINIGYLIRNRLRDRCPRNLW